jgi:hypothetical protein
MKLDAYPQPIVKNTVNYGNGGPFAGGFPDYVFYPPVYSDWAVVLWYWDGSVNYIFPNITLPSGLNINGFRADCFATTTVPGPNNSADNTRQTIGDAIPYAWPYPYTVLGLSNPMHTQYFTPNPNGSLTSHPSAGDNMNAFGYFVIAFITAGAGAVVGGAIAGAGAAGAGAASGTGSASLTSADTAAIYGDAGYGGVTGSTVGEGVGSGVGTGAGGVADSGLITVDTGIPAGTAGTPMDLPAEFTPSYTPPPLVDSIVPLSPADIAEMGPTAGSITDLVGSILPDASSLLPAAGAGAASSGLPSAGQVASGASALNRLLGAVSSIIGKVSGISASGVTSSQMGTTAPGAMGAIGLAAIVGIILLSGKRK